MTVSAEFAFLLSIKDHMSTEGVRTLSSVLFIISWVTIALCNQMVPSDSPTQYKYGRVEGQADYRLECA